MGQSESKDGDNSTRCHHQDIADAQTALDCSGGDAGNSNVSTNTENESTTRLPTLTSVPQDSLLTEEDVSFLVQALPSTEHTAEWDCLFASTEHGASFNRFGAHVRGKCPCIVLIEAEGGYVFGGFCPQPLTKAPDFTGTPHAFVFQLRRADGEPARTLFRPSGINNNYVYYNYANTMLPNCFAMGGQKEYWGFSIDESFEHGTSRGLCTTFKSPCLAAEAEYKIVRVEVWGTQRPVVPSDSDEEGEGKTSVLHGDKNGTRIVMDLAGARQETSVYGDEYAGNT